MLLNAGLIHEITRDLVETPVSTILFWRNIEFIYRDVVDLVTE